MAGLGAATFAAGSAVDFTTLGSIVAFAFALFRFNSAFSSSISACISASTLASAGEMSGGEVADERGSVLTVGRFDEVESSIGPDCAATEFVEEEVCARLTLAVHASTSRSWIGAASFIIRNDFFIFLIRPHRENRLVCR